MNWIRLTTLVAILVAVSCKQAHHPAPSVSTVDTSAAREDDRTAADCPGYDRSRDGPIGVCLDEQSGAATDQPRTKRVHD